MSSDEEMAKFRMMMEQRDLQQRLSVLNEEILRYADGLQRAGLLVGVLGSQTHIESREERKPRKERKLDELWPDLEFLDRDKVMGLLMEFENVKQRLRELSKSLMDAGA